MNVMNNDIYNSDENTIS